MDKFAANLADVSQSRGADVYVNPEVFLKNTYPTEGLKTTVSEIFSRLVGTETGSPVIKLETALGGGKTHTLICLYHLAKHGTNIKGIEKITKLIFKPMKVASIVGTQLNLLSEEGPRTIWGEIAQQLFGENGYAELKNFDESRVSPGEDVLRRLIGDEKCLILIDEIGLYLAKASSIEVKESTLAKNTIAFLQEISQFASSNNNVSLVITSLTKDNVFDEQSREIEKLTDQINNARAQRAIVEADRVISRVVTSQTPTRGEEFASVVRHRLFKNYKIEKGHQITKAYFKHLTSEAVKDSLPSYASDPRYLETLNDSFPFHPELIRILRTKTSSIPNFNKTRGVLRLLSRLVHHIWTKKIDTPLIFPYHIDFHEKVFADELISRLDFGHYKPAVAMDIADKQGQARASVVDANHNEPLGTQIATTVLLHSLMGATATEAKRGATVGELQLAVARPELDPKIVEHALEQLEQTCFYLIRSGSYYAYSNEPNLNKIIVQYEDAIEKTAISEELEDRINQLYGRGGYFDSRLFKNTPDGVPDKADKLKLVVMHFKDCSTSRNRKPPAEVDAIFKHAGTQKVPRIFVNNLLFLISDLDQRESMETKAREFLALKRLCEDFESGDSDLNLSDNQKRQIKNRRKETELYLKVAIVSAYRHIYIPSQDSSGKLKLRQLTQKLSDSELKRDLKNKIPLDKSLIEYLEKHELLRTSDSRPLAPEYVLEHLWPKKTESLSGKKFLELHYQKPRANLILAKDLIQETLRSGIAKGKWFAVQADRLYDRDNAASFPGGLREELQIIRPETETARKILEEFICQKCDKRKETCVCESPTCPECGKTRGKCKCQTPPPPPPSKGEVVVKEIKLIRAGEDIRDLLREQKVELVSELHFRAHSRPGLARIWMAQAQFAAVGAELKFNLTAEIDNEYEHGNYLNIQYRGDAKGFKAAKEIFLNYEGKDDFDDSVLQIEAKFTQPKSVDGIAELLSGKLPQFTEENVYTVKAIPAEEEEDT